MSMFSQSDVLSDIEKALEIAPGSLGESSCAEEVEGWDSLGQLTILVSLDKLFDGKLGDIPEMAAADSVPKILNILREHSLIE